MNCYSVYKHTAPNGKCYIGATSRKPKDRWGKNGGNYLTVLPSGVPKHAGFYEAILKFGWNNIEHKVLFTGLSKERAFSLEHSLIIHYKKLGKSYNLADGGLGISGYKFNEKQLKNLSESHKGLVQSKETIAKRVAKNIGKKRTDETKKIRSKAVIQLTLEGQKVKEFFGVREASRQTGINGSHIGDCCNGKPNRLTAGGYKWCWKYPNAQQVASMAHDLIIKESGKDL